MKQTEAINEEANTFHNGVARNQNRGQYHFRPNRLLFTGGSFLYRCKPFLFRGEYASPRKQCAAGRFLPRRA